MKYKCMMLMLILMSEPALAQISDSKNTDTTDLRKTLDEEILLEGTNTEEEDSELKDDLENLKRNPLDLNMATFRQLEAIPFISSVIARNILEYKKKNLVFKSKRELLKIDGITEDLYEKVKVFLVVRQKTRDIIIDETGKKFSTQQTPGRDFKTKLRTKFLRELQPKAGYLSGKYEGNNSKIYTRVSVNYFNKLFLMESNVTIEKDAGEKNYADFVSGFVELKDFKFVRNFVAGDYSLNFGQGLTMWTGQSFSKGIDAVNPVKRKGKGVDGYSSTNESQFFRGAASKINIRDFNVSLFYSENFYSASMDTNTNGIRTFYYDGYHRMASETSRKNSVKEKLLGGRLSIEKGSLRLGATHWSGRFSKPVVRDTVKELFDFYGQHTGSTGIDYDFIFRNMNFYGEWTRAKNGSVASVNSMQITFLRFADLLFMYRHYPKNFIAFHSFGFGERNGESKNENGIYAALAIRPFKGLVINSYYDQYEFPYRTFSNPVPVSGNDFLLNAEMKISRELQANLKFKKENKEMTQVVKDEFNREVKKIENRKQLNIRTGFIYQITENFRLRSRFEYVYVDYKNYGGDSKGTLFYSDVRVIPFAGLVFDWRIVFFNTGNYDSRIYEFENDISGAMSNVALYGKGRRWYAVMKYKPFQLVNISLKYAETFLDGVKSSGTGNDKIEGDINNKFSLSIEAGF